MDVNKRTTTPPNAGNHPAPSPVTPRPVLGRSIAGTDGKPKLQSTPSNRGSASLSEFISDTRDESVGPPIYADVKHHKDECTVGNLLNGMLSRCLPKDDKHKLAPDVLDSCLKAVLPICNDETKGMGLRDYLTEYCRYSKEADGYKPLVFAFNCALRELRKIDVPLRKSTKSEEEMLLFHTNDPKKITIAHNGNEVACKPDIVLVSLGAARDAFKDEGDKASQNDSSRDTASQNDFSRDTASWDDYALNTAEVKRTKYKPPPPSRKYAVKDVDVIRPIYETVEDRPAQGKSARSSEKEMPKPLKDAAPVLPRPRRSNRIASRSNASRSSQSSAIPSILSITSTTSSPTSSVLNSKKRTRDLESDGSNKKTKEEPADLKIEAIRQSAIRAAGRLCHSYRISHAINLIIIDDVAYVWWYDTEGAIQSYGINFIEDLPHFLVLLLCFDRFSAKDWGIVSEFTERAAGDCVLSIPDPSCPDSTFTIDINQTQKIRGHFGIVGRATQMLSATSQSTILGRRGESRDLKNTELVLKVYWPEESRVNEAVIIDEAGRIAVGNGQVERHIPDLIWARDFDEYSTKNIRMACGIKSEGHRVLRVMLFRRLYPITDLTGDRFWKAFWQCFRCHYHLWHGGVEHNDISVSNLMYDKDNEDRGILNDFDLAHLRGGPRPSGTERTGTMPFMALDLLTEDAWDGKVPRLYRHDCESFAWVLLWICCRFEDGKEIHEPPLNELITADFKVCRAMKLDYLSPGLFATTSYKPYWRAVTGLLNWAVDHELTRRRQKEDEPAAPVEEPTIYEVIEIYRKILEKRGYKDLLVLENV